MPECPNVKSVGTLITRVHTVAGRQAGAEDLIAKCPHAGERNHIKLEFVVHASSVTRDVYPFCNIVHWPFSQRR